MMPMTPRTFRFSDTLSAQLDALCHLLTAESGLPVTPSDAVRYAIETTLATKQPRPPRKSALPLGTIRQRDESPGFHDTDEDDEVRYVDVEG